MGFVKRDWSDWLRNWRIWLNGFGVISRVAEDGGWSRAGKIRFFAFWVLNVGVNTLTGGDPEESISSRVHKDRKTVVGNALMQFIESATRDEQHGENVVNLNVGEGSVNNREISVGGQTVLILATVAVLLIIFRWATVFLLAAGYLASRGITGAKKPRP